MTIIARRIGTGQGWQVRRFICSAGPRDRPYEQRHDLYSVSLVTSGSFDYRSGRGTSSLVPGALLLGNHGECFHCCHAHGSGDDCLSFRYEPALWEEIASAVPGLRSARFGRVAEPPDWRLTPLLAEAAALGAGTALPGEVEELALRLAGAILARTVDAPAVSASDGIAPGARDRIIAAVRMIEAQADAGEKALSLVALAGQAGMSRFHFLRRFRQVVGMTPHQYLLRLRLQRAATRLRRGEEPIANIAFGEGFGDLSTFIRQFRRVFGAAPAAYRAGRRSDSA